MGRPLSGDALADEIVAASVRIGAEDFVCEVVVARKLKGNSFYLHEVNLKEKLSDTIKTARLSEVNPSAFSKVVDENGEPKVVYHGTRSTSRFDVFEGSEHFFSDSKEVADGFLNGNDFVLKINGDRYPVFGAAVRPHIRGHRRFRTTGGV